MCAVTYTAHELYERAHKQYDDMQSTIMSDVKKLEQEDGIKHA